MSSTFDFRIFRDCLERGTLEPIFKRPRSGQALGMISLEFLVGELRAAIDRGTRIAESNLVDIARRLVLGRRPDEVREFGELWVRAGSADASAEHLACAIESALTGWPSTSGAHANFVKALNSRVIVADHGPLGSAVRETRYRVGSPADHLLAGERSQPAGFPVVVSPRATGRPWTSRLAPAIWVSAKLRPAQGEGRMRAGLPDVGSVGRSEGFVGELSSRWNQLISSIPGIADRDRTILDQMGIELPQGVHWLATELGVSTLDSAGLGLALEYHATSQNRAIPAGVGFTGRWQGGLLKGVSGISAKLGAAREAGVFLLFACLAPGEEVLPETGVHLERLEENLSFDEVVVRVNTACARFGVTEHRWEMVIRQMSDRLGAATKDRWLPEAATSTSLFPVGFVGRTGVLDTLERWDSEAESGNRRLNRLVIGPPRAGKTSVLARWMQRLAERHRRTPLWFSFLRESEMGREFDHFRSSLTEQIEARHCVLLRPRARVREGDELQEILEDTRIHVDIVVDGLDEAEPASQAQVLRMLARLVAPGLTILSSQPLAALSDPVYRWQSTQLGDSASVEQRDDADALIGAFAATFRESAEDQLGDIGEELSQPSRRCTLIDQTGANLWILKDLLSSIRAGRAELPRPGDRVAVSGDINEYSRTVLEEVKSRFSAPGAHIDQTDFEILLRHLSLNGAQPWPLHELIRFGFEGRSLDHDAEIRWRDALRACALRLLDCRDEDGECSIRYRDAWFAHYVRSQTPSHQLGQIVKKLVRSLQTDSGHLPTIRDFAVQNAAILVSSEAPRLTGMLVDKTDWASMRFFQLVTRGRLESTNSGSYLGLFVAELTGLQALCSEPSVTSALRDLRDAMSEWSWAASTSSSSAAAWWEGLAAVRTHQVWQRQMVNRRDGSADLLVPRGGYQVHSQELPLLDGPACELPGGSIVLAGRERELRGTRSLVVLDPRTEVIRARMRLDLPPVRQMVAIGEDTVVLLAGYHEEEGAVLVRVDFDRWSSSRKEIAGEAIGLINLGGGREGRVLLAAVSQGERFAFLSFDEQLTQRCEQSAELPSWNVQRRSQRLDRCLMAFSDNSFAAWLSGENGRTAGAQILCLDGDGTIRERTPMEVQGSQAIRGCMPLSGGRLLVAVPPEPGSQHCKLFSVGADGPAVTVSLVQVPGLPRRPQTVSFEPLFSHARPLGYLDGVGIIFGIADRHEEPAYWSIPRLDSEPSPQRVLGGRFPSLELENSLSLSDGRLLMVDENGLVIVHEDPSKVRVVGNPGRYATTCHVSVEGALRDGSVVVREYVNSRDAEFGPSQTLRIERLDQERPRILRDDRRSPTRSGYLAVRARDSIKARCGGFSGRTEVVATAEALSSSLSIDGTLDLKRTVQDVERDADGNWSFLIDHGAFRDVVLRDHASNLEFLGGFEGFNGDWSGTIEQSHGRAVLVRMGQFDEGWERETRFFLVNGPEDEHLTNVFHPVPPLLPLTPDWALIRGYHDPDTEPRVFLLRVGAGNQLTPVDDLDLGAWCFVSRVYAAIDGSVHVDIVSIERSSRWDAFSLFVHRRRLDPKTPALVEREGRSRVQLVTPLDLDAVTAWTPVAGNLIAIGYRSRRCEIIELPDKPGIHGKSVRAEAFLTCSSDSMVAYDYLQRKYLAVASGDRLEWFEVP